MSAISFEEHGKAYLVMEFIEGKTLEKVQNDANGPLNEQLVMGWALQLCDVLNYLHTQPQPIVFRDLKPSNVMVTKNGQVKLIDFGIARIFKSTAARDTTTLGSRGYAPLEQYGRGQSDARSDIYALGATLYDLLTKTVPTDAPTRRINPPLFENPRRLNPAISIETERIILKAMAEEPRDRYQTAAEMAQAIVASRVLPATSPGRSYAGTLPGYATIPAPTSTQPAPPPTIPANSALSTQAATIPAASVPSTPQAIAATPPTIPKTISASTKPPAPAFAAHAQSTPRQQQTLVPAGPGGTPPPGQQRISRRALLIGGLVAAGVVVGGGYTAVHFLSSPPPPTGSTIQIPFVYSTEKADWLTAAASSFSNSPQAKLTGSNKTIQVLLNDSGSLDVADKILNGEIKPVAWSPASTLELNRLTYKWKQAKGQSQDIFATSTNLAPVPLVSSPLIFAAWKDRAQAFLKKYPTCGGTISKFSRTR